MLALLLVLARLAGLPARAGTSSRADVQALLPPSMVVGERPAGLPAWPIFRRAGATLELQAPVFETIELEPVAGCGGKPVNLLVVLERDGRFRAVRLLSHTEPMLTSQQGTAVLSRFAQQYRGLTVDPAIHVLGPRAERTQTETTATLADALTKVRFMGTPAQALHQARRWGVDVVAVDKAGHLHAGGGWA